MTTAVFVGHLEEIPRLRAMRLLDGANAAHPSDAWIDRQLALIKGDDPEAEPSAPEHGRVSTDGNVMPFRLRVRDPHGHGNSDSWLAPRDFARRAIEVMSS